MTLDELMKENVDILRRMKEEDDRFDVRRLAHEYWNWGIMPPAEYYYNVGEYIKCHPEEFKARVRSDPPAPARRFNRILILLTLFCNIFMV